MPYKYGYGSFLGVAQIGKRGPVTGAAIFPWAVVGASIYYYPYFPDKARGRITCEILAVFSTINVVNVLQMDGAAAGSVISVPLHVCEPVGSGGDGGDVPVAGQSIALVAVIGLVAARFGPWIARAVSHVVRGIGGARVLVNRLPHWVRVILLFVGINVMTEILMDSDTPDPYGGALGPGEEGTIVNSWIANGTLFVQLLDNRLGAQKKNGSWTFWRPKKPVVIYPGGMSNLRDLRRADKVINTQTKALKSMYDRRAGTRRRTTPPVTKIVETGPGHVVTT